MLSIKCVNMEINTPRERTMHKIPQLLDAIYIAAAAAAANVTRSNLPSNLIR